MFHKCVRAIPHSGKIVDAQLVKRIDIIHIRCIVRMENGEVEHVQEQHFAGAPPEKGETPAVPHAADENHGAGFNHVQDFPVGIIGTVAL